jgi:tetratricopeptide (TPR) repeat protein
MKTSLSNYTLPFFFNLCFLFFLFSCSSPQDEVAKHYESAKNYFAAQEYEKAKIEFQNVIQLEPDNDKAQFDLGETYVHLQDPAKAAAAFHQAVVLNPENLQAKLRLGQILLLAKETKKAREIANKILEKHPENIEALHFLATIQIQERNVNLALKTLEKAIEIDASDPKTHFFLAHLLFVSNRLKEAEPYYLKAIELDETQRKPYMELAALYRKKGEIGKIEPLIRRWVHVPGDQVQKSADLAHYLESEGKIEKAEKTFLEASLNDSKNPVALSNLGDFYARQKENAKALEIFNRALALDSENMDIMSRTALLYFLENDYEKADSIVNGILAKNEDHVQANFLKGRLHFNRKEFSQAFKRFEAVIKTSPRHPLARYFKARCLLDKGKSDLPGQDIFRVAGGYKTSESWERKLATDELKEVLEIDPNLIAARLLLIDIFLGNKETLKAKRHINYILKREPQNIQALVFAGKLKIMENDLAGAEKIYQFVLELQPDFAAGYVSLGLALREMEKTDQALKAFDRALEINPDQMEALHYKVSIHMQEKQVDKAIEACDRHRKNFLEDNPALAIIDLIQGRIYMTTGEIDMAEDQFQTAVKRNPDLSAPWEQLAVIRELKKDTDGAIKYYETLLALNKEHLPTYLNLSRIYRVRGDLKKAKTYLVQALDIKDDYAPAANNLAFMLAETNASIYEALRLAKTARDKEPNNPDFLDTLGWIYYLQGSYDMALSVLEESVEINPQNPIANYHLGWAYYDKKQFEKARVHMKKALELNPNFKGAEKARDILGK